MPVVCQGCQGNLKGCHIIECSVPSGGESQCHSNGQADANQSDNLMLACVLSRHNASDGRKKNMLVTKRRKGMKRRDTSESSVSTKAMCFIEEHTSQAKRLITTPVCALLIVWTKEPLSRFKTCSTSHLQQSCQADARQSKGSLCTGLMQACQYVKFDLLANDCPWHCIGPWQGHLDVAIPVGRE